MVRFPCCKINLGLHVLRKREDGFHDIETVFFPVPLRDILELVPSESFSFSQSGIPLEGSTRENLCWKAYQTITALQGIATPLGMHLHKAIPVGAGLGGGSSDGACCLTMLDELLDLHLQEEILQDCANSLGSDCAFFLQDKPCRATGRGNILEPLDLNLAGYQFLVVCPSFPVSTAWAYSQIRPGKHPDPVGSLIGMPIEEWKTRLGNDFETPVFRAFPQLASIKATLYEHGACYASLSGSGSAIFGIFWGKPPFIGWEKGYQAFCLDPSAGLTD